MDPYTLAYLAGHSDFSTTRRYVHPQTDTIRKAIERARKARGGHKIGHSDEKSVQTRAAPEPTKELKGFDLKWSGREDSNLRPPGPEAGCFGQPIDYTANIFVLNFKLSTKNALVGGQLGGQFAPKMISWLVHRRVRPAPNDHASLNALVPAGWRIRLSDSSGIQGIIV